LSRHGENKKQKEGERSMNKRRLAGFSVMLAILLVGSALLWAQMPRRGGGPGWGAGREGSGAMQMRHRGEFWDNLHALAIIAAYLELTEEQRQQIRSAFEEHRETAAGLHEQRRDLWSRLREALKVDNPDPVTVGNLTIQISELRKQLQDLREATAEAVKAVLTPDQLDKVAAVREAARLELVIHAFRELGLIAPPEPQPEEPVLP
jgi:Spy/CpxP family protein refolding chaperone